MRRLALAFAWMTCLLPMSATAAFPWEETNQPPSIAVHGEAEVRVVPDHVMITAGVESRGATLEETVADSDARIRKVLEFLEQSKIEARKIRTEYLTIEPLIVETVGKAQVSNLPPQTNDPFASEPSAPRVVGYVARRQFSICIEQLDRFEAIYKGLITAGINRVSGIEFRTTELRQMRDKARQEAVRAAREKAQAMAGELGAKLASVQSIRENLNNGMMPSYMAQNALFDAPAEATDRSLAAGEISVRASVDVVFLLGDVELKP
ncbi:MAG: SIMPL domain-containing protein [Pirellulaceae bacterium]|jgi:uncharacterized protein YggE